MRGSRVASRIVIAVVLVVVFGVGVSFIVLPAMQGAQSQPANTASPAAARAAAELPAPQTSAAARDADVAPETPPGAASSGAPASNLQLAANSGSDQTGASGNDTKASTPKRE
jgi:hypothetical protein